MTTSTSDSAAVGDALCRWLSARFGGAVSLQEPVVRVSGGMDSRIHLVRFTGEVLPGPWRAPLVARVLPGPDRHEQAVREAHVQAWCAERGYPTPRVLAVAAPGEVLATPVQVMERAPGTTMVAALTARPWTAPALVDRLAGLHAQLHGIDAGSGDEAPAIGSLLDRRLGLVREVTGRLGSSDLGRALERVERLAPRLAVADPSVCHGDLHPLNVLVDGPTSTVIDWTDAGLGDRHGDVARTALLFRVAAVAATSPVERVALRGAGPVLARRYLRAYERRLPLDRSRLRLWEPAHLLHGWAQADAVQAGMLGGSEAGGGSVPPALGGWLRRRFEAGIAAVE